jgi:hypothetical protein
VATTNGPVLAFFVGEGDFVKHHPDRIVAFAVVTGVVDKYIEFKVHAMDGDEEIGRGTHERVVIDLAKFSRRLATKFANEAE